jgi:DNA modification methylase
LDSTSKQLAIQDDAQNIPQYLKEETVSLILTSPPYANLLNRRRKNKSRRRDFRENEQYMKVEQYSQDPRDLGALDPSELGRAVEVCNHCGRSVSFGSGLFVNRVPDFNDIETRKANNLRFIEGDFVCQECDSKLSDDEYDYDEGINV